jgi:hypothetical protein
METIHIRLDKPPQGSNFAKHVEGRTVARNWDRLTVMATEIKIRPLSTYLAPVGTSDDATSPWFSASEAAGVLARLMSQIAHQRLRFENAKKLISELAAYENILRSASARGSRFRFIADDQGTV